MASASPSPASRLAEDRLTTIPPMCRERITKHGRFQSVSRVLLTGERPAPILAPVKPSTTEVERMAAKQVIHTDRVPPARVPLSQAIKAGDWIFASGQLGNDPGTRKLAEGGIGPETRQVCENLKAVLEAAGSSLDHVV